MVGIILVVLVSAVVSALLNWRFGGLPNVAATFVGFVWFLSLRRVHPPRPERVRAVAAMFLGNSIGFLTVWGGGIVTGLMAKPVVTAPEIPRNPTIEKAEALVNEGRYDQAAKLLQGVCCRRVHRDSHAHCARDRQPGTRFEWGCALSHPHLFRHRECRWRMPRRHDSLLPARVCRSGCAPALPAVRGSWPLASKCLKATTSSSSSGAKAASGASIASVAGNLGGFLRFRGLPSCSF